MPRSVCRPVWKLNPIAVSVRVQATPRQRRRPRDRSPAAHRPAQSVEPRRRASVLAENEPLAVRRPSQKFGAVVERVGQLARAAASGRHQMQGRVERPGRRVVAGDVGDRATIRRKEWGGLRMTRMDQRLDRPGADINRREIALGPVIRARRRNVGKDDGLAVGRPVESRSRVTVARSGLHG